MALTSDDSPDRAADLHKLRWQPLTSGDGVRLFCGLSADWRPAI